jgi:hypothetical protein
VVWSNVTVRAVGRMVMEPRTTNSGCIMDVFWDSALLWAFNGVQREV